MLSCGAYQASADAEYATARYCLLLLPHMRGDRQAFAGLRETCHRWGIPAWRNAMTSGKALRPVLPASPVFLPLGALPFPPTQCLSRLAPCPSRKPSISPAWHPALPANPVFVPLGGLFFPQAQCLSRLAACSPANPVFVPLGGLFSRQPSVYPAWRLVLVFLLLARLFNSDQRRVK